MLDVSEFKHYRINHLKLFADKQNHINGIENFWNQAKRHLPKFLILRDFVLYFLCHPGLAPWSFTGKFFVFSRQKQSRRPRFEIQGGVDERLGVGFPRGFENLGGGAGFHDFAVFHDQNVMRHGADDA